MSYIKKAIYVVLYSKHCARSTILFSGILFSIGLSGCTSPGVDLSPTSSISPEGDYMYSAMRNPTAKRPEIKALSKPAAKTTNRDTTVKAASIRYPGRATYICTPSGFGQHSSCFLR